MQGRDMVLVALVSFCASRVEIFPLVRGFDKDDAIFHLYAFLLTTTCLGWNNGGKGDISEIKHEGAKWRCVLRQYFASFLSPFFYCVFVQETE